MQKLPCRGRAPDLKQGPHQGSKHAQRKENVGAIWSLTPNHCQSLPQSKPLGDQVACAGNSGDGRMLATRTGIAERAQMRNLRSFGAVWTRTGTSVSPNEQPEAALELRN
jgi:hypothetical protein